MKIIDHINLLTDKIPTEKDEKLFKNMMNFFTSLRKKQKITFIMNGNKYPLK